MHMMLVLLPFCGAVAEVTNYAFKSDRVWYCIDSHQSEQKYGVEEGKSQHKLLQT